MDPEPSGALKKNQVIEHIAELAENEDSELISEDESIAFNGPSIILIGLTIAIASLGLPITAVLTERPSTRESVAPTALKNNGSQSSLPFPFTRIGESSSRDTSWKQEQIRVFR